MLHIKKCELVEEITNEDIISEFSDDRLISTFSSSYHVTIELQEDGKKCEIIKKVDFCNFRKKNCVIEDSASGSSGIFQKFDSSMITEYYGEHIGHQTRDIIPFALANWYNINLKCKWNVVPLLSIDGGMEFMLDDNLNSVIDVEQTLRNVFVDRVRIYFETRSEWTKYNLMA